MKKIIQTIFCVLLFFQSAYASSSSSAENNILGRSRAQFTQITIAGADIPFSVFQRDIEFSDSGEGFTQGKWYQMKPISQESPNVYRMQTTFDPWDLSAYAIGVVENEKIIPYIKPRSGKNFSGKSRWIINGHQSDTIE